MAPRILKEVLMKLEKSTKKIIIQAHFGNLGNRARYIDKVKSFARDHGYEYLFIEEWPEDLEYTPDTQDPVVLSEYLRFQLPLFYPNVIWVDTDGYIKKLWDMKPGIPYFTRRKKRDTEVIDYCLFDANGCTQWFEDTIKRHKKREIQPVYTGWSKVLRDIEVGRIDEEYYEHESITFKEKIEKKRKKKKKDPNTVVSLSPF